MHAQVNTALSGCIPKLLLPWLPCYCLVPWNSPCRPLERNHPLPQLWEAGLTGRSERKKVMVLVMNSLSPSSTQWRGRLSLPMVCLLLPVAAPQNFLRAEEEGGNVKEASTHLSQSLKSTLSALWAETRVCLLELLCLHPEFTRIFTLPWAKARRHQRENTNFATSSIVLGILGASPSCLCYRFPESAKICALHRWAQV